jgi:amino acid transporter
VADIIVMANLAQIAGKYTFLLFNADGLAENVFWVTFLGCVFIAVMTWICYVGIEASARTQYFLLGAELELAQPLRHRRPQRADGRDPRGGVHLLRLGLDGHRQRGEPGLLAHAGVAAIISTIVLGTPSGRTPSTT